MINMNFNPYAMINPTTPEEYLIVLNEALCMAQELNDDLDQIYKQMDDEQNGSD